MKRIVILSLMLTATALFFPSQSYAAHMGGPIVSSAFVMLVLGVLGFIYTSIIAALSVIIKLIAKTSYGFAIFAAIMISVVGFALLYFGLF